jgi:hypothetical protein
MSYVSQSTILAYFLEFRSIVFTTISGGETTTPVTEVFPQAGKPPENIEGPTSCSAVTVSKPLNLAEDAPLFRFDAENTKGRRARLTLVKQTVDAEGLAVGPPRIYRNCSLQSFNDGDANTAGSEARMLTITVKPTHVE